MVLGAYLPGLDFFIYVDGGSAYDNGALSFDEGDGC